MRSKSWFVIWGALLCLSGLSIYAAEPKTESEPQPQANLPITNIVIMSIDATGQPNTKQLIKATNQTGYHNQPHFINNDSIYFTKQMDEQTDIWRFDMATNSLSAVTQTLESEYSPTLMPDGKHFSTIRVEQDGTQRLWQFDLNGTNPQLILKSIKPVGYHSWLNPDSLALFVLGEPATLQLAKVSRDKAKVLDADIGRSIHKVPGKSMVSYTVHREQQHEIRVYDLASGKNKRLTDTRNGQQDYVWLNKDCLLMAEQNKLYQYCLGGDWQLFADLPMLGKITRLALNQDNSQLAIVHDQIIN
jgi:hypothetical protein